MFLTSFRHISEVVCHRLRRQVLYPFFYINTGLLPCMYFLQFSSSLDLNNPLIWFPWNYCMNEKEITMCMKMKIEFKLIYVSLVLMLLYRSLSSVQFISNVNWYCWHCWYQNLWTIDNKIKHKLAEL
jgi:hypothetical protein